MLSRFAILAQESSRQTPAVDGRAVERMAAASITLAYFLGAMVVVFMVAWVILAVIKQRLAFASKIAKPGKPPKVKDVWAEAGRRLEVEPAKPNPGDGGAPDGGGGGGGGGGDRP